MAGEVALDVCLHHHERIDGRGYPEQLSGEQISLFARMGAVCDVYDAISSERCYKRPWRPGESIRKMASWREGQFKVFFSTKSNGPIRMEVVDLQRSQDAIEGLEDPVAWGFDLRKLTGV